MSWLAALLRSKIVVWILLVTPGLWPAWPLFVQEDPTALTDPLKYILHHWGFVACVLLAVVLTFSPLRGLFPRAAIAQALNRHRRLVGVSVFAYALLHFAAHTRHVYDGTFETFFKEIQKTFQLTGLAVLVILLVLTITSVNAAVRWLGARTWKNLHRGVYLAAARKIFPMQVVWIFGPVVVLQVARVWKQRRRPVGAGSERAARGE